MRILAAAPCRPACSRRVGEGAVKRLHRFPRCMSVGEGQGAPHTNAGLVSEGARSRRGA